MPIGAPKAHEVLRDAAEALAALFPKGAEGVEGFCWCHDGYGQKRSDLGRCEMALVECDKVVEGLTLGGGEDGRIIGIDDLCRLLDSPRRWIVQ